MEKNKSPLWWLLMIPIQLGISVLIVSVGVFADTRLWANVEADVLGHPAPVFTILAFLAAIGLFFLVSFISVTITIIKVIKNNKNK